MEMSQKTKEIILGQANGKVLDNWIHNYHKLPLTEEDIKLFKEMVERIYNLSLDVQKNS